MSAVAYTERILTTSNTRLAAVLVLFGARLRKVLPLEWIDEFRDKAHFMAWLRDPKRNDLKHLSSGLRFKTTVFFNFEPDGVDARAISEAFASETADDEFRDMVNDLEIDSEHRARLLAAYSKATAASAREVLDARDYLMGLMRAVPESAKWNQVRGAGKGQFARFGKEATHETIAEQLSKIS